MKFPIPGSSDERTGDGLTTVRGVDILRVFVRAEQIREVE